MIKRFFILSAIFGTSLFAGSHWDEEQVVDYVHHSELQRRSSWHLLSQIKFDGNENVLDVGCGDGRNTAWIAWLVRQGNVIGIDPSVSMIAWAKKQYHPFEFPNLTFADGDANHLPEGIFDTLPRAQTTKVDLIAWTSDNRRVGGINAEWVNFSFSPIQRNLPIGSF